MPGLAEAIESRMREVGILGPSALAQQAGVTVPGLAPLRRGERRAYQDRRKVSVCAALGWTPDSIDRLLRGDRPELTSRPPEGDEVGELRGLVARLAVDLETLQKRVDALTGVTAEQAARPAPRPAPRSDPALP